MNTMQRIFARGLAGILLPAIPLATSAQVAIPAPATPVTIDFTGFLGTGFQPAPAAGQLDSDDWALTGMSEGAMVFGDTKTTGDFARGATAGDVSSGGLYALNYGSGNQGLILQPTSSDWNPGTITLRLQNNTGGSIEELAVSYDLLVLNNEDRSNTFNFSYSSDNVSYTAVSGLNYTSPALQDAGAPVAVPQSTTITGLAITDGSFVYLRWSSADAGGSGSRDELGLDNISVTASAGGTVSAFGFGASSLSVSEGDSSFNLDVNLSEAADCSVDVVLTGGTASNGSDYSFSSPAPLVFTLLDTPSTSVLVSLLEDLALEGPETITFQLQNPTGTCILGAVTSVTVTIEDNDQAPLGACANLYFSEYIEGSSNNKALEIYNPTPDSVDLSSYTVKVFNNGSFSPSNTQVLSGLIGPGSVYVIANSSADSAVLAVADITSTVTFFNGDDAVVLLNGGDTIDVIGLVGQDPGTNWAIDTLGATSEFTLVRKPGVNAGQKNWGIGAFEWLVYAQNDFSFLGSHDQDPCPVVCSTEEVPSGQSHTLLGTVVRLDWVPQPGVVACQVEGQRLPTGPSPNKNIVSAPYNSLVIPRALAGAGTTWTWRVRCACSIDPLNASAFSDFGDTFFIPVARQMADLRALAVYPNPASSQLNLTWQAADDAASSEITVEILDLMGRLLHTTRVQEQAGFNSMLVDVQRWEPGLYVIRLNGADGGTFSVVR